MERACGNSACSKSFICHNKNKKFCSTQCYPSVIRAAAKQAEKNGVRMEAADSVTPGTA